MSRDLKNNNSSILDFFLSVALITRDITSAKSF